MSAPRKSHLQAARGLALHPRRRWWLALEAAWVLARVKFMLQTRPFRRYRAELEPADEANDVEIEPRAVAEIVWAVDRVSRRFPDALDCLPRALGVKRMLARRGASASVRLGVAPGEGGIRAHAWLVRRDEVLIGALPDLDAFAPLDRWPGAPQ